ncbi:Xanthine phosphoribosyltransferase [Waddlia chondrophila 2032/99]|uniref:Xanthine phosphoribosyltransferase n=1 Tax=Waddlia chondrophila 2032/99 TaxID=765953 RepID=F8LCH7_9BACT|nr:Xanthine phosphoribosyltransferase [Waddlia chondrophila 2032/99]
MIVQNEAISKQYVSWGEIREIIYDICQKIDKSKVDVICGISVGGLVPASFFSLELQEKNVVSVSCQSYNGYKRGKVVIKNGPEKCFLEGKKILLVDDIFDSGNTIVRVSEHLYEYYGVASVDAAALYLNTDHYKYEYPTYWGKETSKWIVFPWEVSYSEFAH